MAGLSSLFAGSRTSKLTIVIINVTFTGALCHVYGIRSTSRLTVIISFRNRLEDHNITIQLKTIEFVDLFTSKKIP